MDKELNNDILNRPGHPDGRTVPDGYFEAFARKMAAKLPPNDLEMQEALNRRPLTRWQRVRPYVYMAAMFAGIWLMMNMFSLMRTNTDGSLDTALKHSPTLTAALQNDDFVNDYILDDYDESQLLEELYTAGYDASSFNPSI